MRRLASLLAFALLLGAGASTLAVAPAGADTNHAVVVVDTGDGVVTRVISFPGTVSGLDALTLAGADPVTYGYAGQGAAVCKLFGVGNETDSCLGTPADPRYWAYYRGHLDSGWSYSRSGAGGTVVHDGDVEGWRFGAGGPPHFVSYCDVVACPPAPTSPPAAVAPADSGSAAAPGGSAAAGPGSSTTGTGAPATAAGSDDATPTTAVGSTSPSTTAKGSTRDSSTRRALGPTIGGSGDGGGGSPLGVVVAVGLVVLIAVAAVLVRRRRRIG